ncbi:MAG: serine/threonine protein kinase [Deltaproteobacteria bacterium]|nr:serine/threonine protein kinase [Deltaproteobacteria bacterium]
MVSPAGSSALPKTLPKRIGAYEIKEALGRGAMGEVFLGVHEHLERPVAIKRRHGDQRSKESEERFLREGRALARLNHHGIIAVHDLFTSRGEWCLVLEYVDGFDLAELIKTGPLPADVAAIIGVHLAEALEHAHFHRIIHRDIKPANVLLSRKGEVKLGDFGIARDESTEDKKLTATGMVVGTPMYLAPELLRGEEAGPPSDIYSVGALLYHALSGRRMFENASGDAIYAAILRGKYRKLSQVAAGVPRALQKIVERCLDRKSEKRFATAADLRRALEAFLVSHQARANHASRLIAFLHARGQLTEQESLTCIDASELVIGDRSELRAPRRWPWAAVLIGLGALLGWYLMYARLIPH